MPAEAGKKPGTTLIKRDYLPMNNVTSITPTHPRLQEINAIRAARGLATLEELHDKWVLELSPLLTLQDFAAGSKETQQIAREQMKTLEAMSAPDRQAA